MKVKLKFIMIFLVTVILFKSGMDENIVVKATEHKRFILGKEYSNEDKPLSCIVENMKAQLISRFTYMDLEYEESSDSEETGYNVITTGNLSSKGFGYSISSGEQRGIISVSTGWDEENNELFSIFITIMGDISNDMNMAQMLIDGIFSDQVMDGIENVIVECEKEPSIHTKQCSVKNANNVQFTYENQENFVKWGLKLYPSQLYEEEDIFYFLDGEEAIVCGMVETPWIIPERLGNYPVTRVYLYSFDTAERKIVTALSKNIKEVSGISNVGWLILPENVKRLDLNTVFYHFAGGGYEILSYNPEMELIESDSGLERVELYSNRGKITSGDGGGVITYATSELGRMMLSIDETAFTDLEILLMIPEAVDENLRNMLEDFAKADYSRLQEFIETLE